MNIVHYVRTMSRMWSRSHFPGRSVPVPYPCRTATWPPSPAVFAFRNPLSVLHVPIKTKSLRWRRSAHDLKSVPVSNSRFQQNHWQFCYFYGFRFRSHSLAYEAEKTGWPFSHGPTVPAGARLVVHVDYYSPKWTAKAPSTRWWKRW